MNNLKQYRMKINSFRNLGLAACFAFGAANLVAQTGIDPALAAALQNSINSLKNTYQVKGIYAAAYVPGKGTWKGVTGVSYGSVPIDTAMLMSIGSITKTFVASEIFKLVESGQLSLDDSLHALLPPIPNVNPDVRVRDLLGHRSGLADYLNGSWETSMFANPYKMWYQPEPLDSFLTAPTGTPGGTWNYVNANYALLGMIVEARKGTLLHNALRSEFLTPLALNNTHMEAFEGYTNPIPHNWSTPNLNPSLAADSSHTPHAALWSSVEAAGGYFSDPADLVKWGYNLYSGNVISQSSLSQMLTFVNVSGGYFNGYGLGAMRFTGNSRTYWGHAGNYYGYAASMLYYPQDSLCVAVLINQDCIAANIAKPLMNTLINSLTTGIEEAAGAQVSMFPNPADKSVTISFKGKPAAKRHVQLSDTSGKTVYDENTAESSCIINTAGLSEGLYILEISNDKEQATSKLVVRHE